LFYSAVDIPKIQSLHDYYDYDDYYYF
jgi:hypothetical protein